MPPVTGDRLQEETCLATAINGQAAETLGFLRQKLEWAAEDVGFCPSPAAVGAERPGFLEAKDGRVGEEVGFCPAERSRRTTLATCIAVKVVPSSACRMPGRETSDNFPGQVVKRVTTSLAGLNRQTMRRPIATLG